MYDFANKVVVVTGGNSGIGQAIAEKFDHHGAKVVIFGRDKARLEAVTTKLNRGFSVQGDIRNLADIERLFHETERKFGKIDVLVANAGIAGRRKVQEVDEQFFDEIVQTNYKALYFTVQRSLPHVNDGASIILISSIAAHQGRTENSVYASTKAAVSMLAKSFSADLLDRGIRVNALSPGFTDTPIFDSLKLRDTNLMEQFLQHIPHKRFAESKEMADAALYLAQASYVVGIDLIVDGGVTFLRS